MIASAIASTLKQQAIIAHASVQETQTASCLYRLWGIYGRHSLREFPL